MTELLKLGKKVFTVGVVTTTILWSVGVAALVPSVANAAACATTLSAGEMVKVAGKPAIYVLNNSLKTMYFPSGDVFKSWRPTYGGYTTITMDCLDYLGIPSAAPYGVNFHPGSYVVKRPSSDQLYVVYPNNVLAKITTDAAKALYGSTFKAMVVEDMFWPNYTVGSDSITSAVAHPGMLVKVGSTTYHVNADKTLSEVTETGMTANGFQTKFVRTLTSAAITGLTAGTKIDAEVKSVTDKTQGGGVVVTTTPVTGNVSVTLSASTPAAGNVVVNIDNVVFTKVNLTAGSSAAVISSLTIGRTGLGQTSDFDSVTVYDGATKLGSTRTSWDSNNQIVYNIPSGLSIAANSTKELTIVGKLGSAKTGTYNALGVVALNGSAITPVYGNQMTGVAVTVGTVTITNVGTSATKNIGTTDVTLANFKLAMNSVEKGSFQRITLKNKGTAADSDIANVSLWWGTKKLAGPVSMVSDKVTFNLSEPVLIDKSKNEEFKVIGDVVAGSANTVNFILENTTDLYAVGQTYNTSMTVTSTNYNTAGNGMTVTIAGAELNIAYSGTAVDTLADKTDVNFGTLTLSAGGTDVKVTSLILTIDETEASGSSGVLDVDNFEMVEANGGAYSGSYTSSTGDNSSGDETWTFDDEIYLTKGQTRTFTLRGDIPASVADGDSYKVTMTVNTTNLVAETVPEGDAVSNFSIGSINGKYVTVKAPYLTIRPVGANNTNAVVNQKDLVIYKATVEATAGAVTISRMRFEGGNTAAGNVTYTAANLDKTNFSDFGLYVQNADGTYQPALQTITSGNMTDGEADFNSFSYTVQPGTSNKVTFVFKGTVSATLDGSNTSVHAQLDTVTAKDADNNTASVKDAAGTAIATTAELETTGVISLGGTGTLYVAMRNGDTGFDKDRVALAGSSYWVGKLRLRAEFEPVKIKDLKLVNSSADDEDSVESVCLYKTQSTAVDQLIGCGTLGTDDVVFFDDINYVVQQGTQDVYINVALRPMSNLANGTADNTDVIKFMVSTSSAANLTATGESSGTDLAFGNNNGTAASGEIVFDLDLDGSFDEATADEGGTAYTREFAVQGSRPSTVAMVSSYGGYTVDTKINGTGAYTMAIFSVTNEANSNTDANGDALNLTLGALKLNLTKHSTTTFSSATIQRINGAVAAVTLDTFDVTSTAVGQTSDTWTLLTASSSAKLGADAKIAAGTTAYYVVKATVSGLDSTATTQVVDWAKLSLSSLGTTDSANNNIQWYDGYNTSGTVVRYLRLDTTSIDGTKISE